MYDIEKEILPKFPRTQHLPLEPNATRDDLIAGPESLEEVLNSKHVYIEEKVDGANCGITIYEGQPLIRNRNHILNKSYIGSKDTPAKAQFSPIWTWFYSNYDKFEKAIEIYGSQISIYGEWLYARHTVEYDLLPSYFLAFDIYDPEVKKFLSPSIGRRILVKAGLDTVPWDSRHTNCNKLTEKELLELRDECSDVSSANREGIYIKVCDDNNEFIKNRYKMVRPNFISGEHWNKSALVKNTLLKG